MILIDFNVSTKFRDSSRPDKHVEQTKVEKFEGNILFSSLNQMNFDGTSRRDDLLSIGYLLVTLLNGFYFPGVKNESFDPFNTKKSL